MSKEEIQVSDQKQMVNLNTLVEPEMKEWLFDRAKKNNRKASGELREVFKFAMKNMK